MEHYKITEDDIQGMIYYLKVYHPENANREYATELLEYMKATYQRLALTNPEVLEELYQAFQGTKAR
ncbi:MAG TPA: hypothetical protein VFI74_05270 [Candidatus Saccharimonadales bacterium]|nr:hypothetical protein [Candidatus Saccharimonadales bacterium]